MEDFTLNNPITFQEQMFLEHMNLHPSSVKATDNISVSYYKRMLYTKLFSCYKFTLFKEWALNWFRFWLFPWGSIGVIYTKEFGWICNPYSVEEWSHQYQPLKIMVTNSHLRETKHGVIGVNAGIIHAMDDYFGLDDVVTRYAEMLAQCERSINVNYMNSNVSMYAEAPTKKVAEDIKEAYSQATSGKPLVVLNKNVMRGQTFNPILGDVKRNFIVPDLFETRRSIVSAYLTEIGIHNVAVQKKERLTQGEYTENNDETKAVISVIYDNIKADMEEINRFSGLGLSVSLRYEEIRRMDTDEIVSKDKGGE